MRIDITAECIALGKPRDACYCAAAIALRKACPDSHTVSVTSTRFWVHGRPYATPPELAAFVRAVDAGERVEPMAFDFDPLAVAA